MNFLRVESDPYDLLRNVRMEECQCCGAGQEDMIKCDECEQISYCTHCQKCCNPACEDEF
jgi:hypothetical protein